MNKSNLFTATQAAQKSKVCPAANPFCFTATQAAQKKQFHKVVTTVFFTATQAAQKKIESDISKIFDLHRHIGGLEK